MLTRSSTLENPFVPEKHRSADDPKFVGKILGAEAEAAMRRVTPSPARKGESEVTDTLALTPEEQAQQQRERERRERLKRGEYVKPLSDSEVPEHLRETLAKWRELAKELDYNGPIVWDVLPGFTLKEHGSKIEPSIHDLDHLLSLDLQNDKPTHAALVFWAPRPLPNSTKKTWEQQRELMTEFRTRFHLPKDHLTSFGSAAILIALMHHHYKNTDEPDRRYWVNTDTLHVNGGRLYIYWDGKKFICQNAGDSKTSDAGFFAFGEEESLV